MLKASQKYGQIHRDVLNGGSNLLFLLSEIPLIHVSGEIINSQNLDLAYHVILSYCVRETIYLSPANACLPSGVRTVFEIVEAPQGLPLEV